jgi:hypothetical protein
MPPWPAAPSAAASTRCLYSAVNRRRLASTTTSGSGRTGGAATGASGVASAALRSTSLRSDSLRSAKATPDEEPKTTTLCFTLIPLLALLTNWGPENCLSYVGTEGTAAALRPQAAMLRDHGIVMAIETHFEFTSFELLRLFDMCEAAPGDWLGICLDTMNLLTMIEDPLSAASRLLPWIVSTHIKDGGVWIDANGLTTFTAPVGHGIVDIRGTTALLSSLDRDIHLSVEDHGGSFGIPIFDPVFLSRFPDLTPGELARVVAFTQQTAARPQCAPLPRPEWPDVCEARLAGDLAALIAIVDELCVSNEPR